MARLSSHTRGGIPCPAFFGAALAFPLVLDLVSAFLEDLGGAGDTGAMTGMAGEPSTTITPSSRTAMSSVTRGSITVVSATATSATVTSVIATRFTEVRAFTGGQERIPGRSVALVTAEMSGGFPLADGRALEVAATEPAAVAGGAWESGYLRMKLL